MKRVYLAGPIAGTTYKECDDWREFAINELARSNLEGISPTRHKGEFSPEQIMGDKGGGNIMTSGRGIATRDRYDTTHCDAILFNLLGAKKVSIGTMVEYGWADLCRTPIVTVIEPSGNPHDHNFVRELSGFVVETLESGLDVCRRILIP